MQLRQLEAAVGEAVRLRTGRRGGGEEKKEAQAQQLTHTRQMWGGMWSGGREGHALAFSVRIQRPKCPCGSPFSPVPDGHSELLQTHHLL